jgi:hypothetical protein
LLAPIVLPSIGVSCGEVKHAEDVGKSPRIDASRRISEGGMALLNRFTLEVEARLADLGYTGPRASRRNLIWLRTVMSIQDEYIKQGLYRGARVIG